MFWKKEDSVETQQKGGIRTDGAVKPCCSGGGNAAAEQTEEQESKPSCCGGKNGTKEKETASVFEFMRGDQGLKSSAMIGQCQHVSERSGIQACVWTPVKEDTHKIIF